MSNNYIIIGDGYLSNNTNYIEITDGYNSSASNYLIFGQGGNYIPPTPPSTFLPTDISGLALWLRSDLGISLNGSTVSEWADQSGNLANALQGNASLQPAYSSSGGPNGVPYLSWTAAGNSVALAATLTVNQPSEYFIVCRNLNSGGNFVRLIDCGVNDLQTYVDNTQQVNMYSGADFATGNSLTLSADSIVDNIFNGASSQSAVNGGTLATGNAGASNGNGTVTIGNSGGGGGSWVGRIYEVIVYNQTLTSDQRILINTYLSNRYNITI